ncbi:MAG: GTPase HflX, partial [Nitrospirota bacterium]
MQEIIVGTDMVLSPTTLSKFRAGPRSLRGLRLIRTQLQDKPLSQEDLTDLGYLRLDLIGILSVSQNGTPGTLYLAHLLPPNETGRLCEILKSTTLEDCPIVFDQFIKDLETDLQEALKHHAVTSGS